LFGNIIDLFKNDASRLFKNVLGQNDSDQKSVKNVVQNEYI
jgi:hypothetical protein